MIILYIILFSYHIFTPKRYDLKNRLIRPKLTMDLILFLVHCVAISLFTAVFTFLLLDLDELNEGCGKLNEFV